MPADAGYFLALLILSSLLNVVAHVLRARLTLGPLYALAGIQVLLLWQVRQLGWWVEWGSFGIDVGLVGLLPALIAGVLMTHALDGVRASRAYVLVVLVTAVLGWGFAAMRQEVAEHVPIPFAFELSMGSNLGVLLGLASGALSAVLTFEAVRRLVLPLALPFALFMGLAGYLLPSSLVEYGRVVGWANVAEQLPEFALFGLPAALLLLLYGLHARHRRGLMPARRLGDVLRIWRSAESTLEETRREFLEARRTINELRQLNQALDASRQVNELQVAHSPFGVLYTGADGQVSDANPAARALFGEVDPAGTPVNRWLGAERGIDLEALAVSRASPVVRLAARGETWVELTVMQRYGLHGAPLGYQLFLRDVTAARRAMRTQAIEERVRGIHQTGRVIVHDFSNLLLGMQGALAGMQVAFRSHQASAFAEGLATLRQGITRGREMLRQIGAGESFAQPRLAVVDLAALLREAAAICRPAAAEKAVEILTEALPELTVRADATQITRVFTNLVSNAVRAVAQGGRIELRAAADGGGALAEIVDDGPGLPAEALERAFEPGFSSKGSGQGGLGLAIAYLIVEAHGGRLTLAPARPHGLCARVWLPQAEAGAAELVAGLSVVVFLADPAQAADLAARLDGRGAEQVAEVTSLEELTAVLAEERCDLVLADRVPPGVPAECALLELDPGAAACRVRASARLSADQLGALGEQLGWRPEA